MSLNESAKCAILIPAYNPPIELIKYVEDLWKEGFHNIIVVNDGSCNECDSIFESIQGKCTILRHAVNLGKGRALKNGFNYYLNNKTTEPGIITVDSDGQHAVEDVVKCNTVICKNSSNTLCLGCRDFNADNVPPKSRYGNKITRNVLKLLYGLHITDTQTGLRGFTNDVVIHMLDMEGERFEYETKMLIAVKNLKIQIVEIPIRTIYINNNGGTSFNPIVDSFKIYRIILKEFLKYSMISILSFLIDISLFSLICSLFHMKADGQIFVATLGARAVSSLFNYLFNRKVVFSNNTQIKNTIFKYYTLCVCQAACSAFMVWLMVTNLKLPAVITKIIVDSILFVVSFRVQKLWVFRENV